MFCFYVITRAILNVDMCSITQDTSCGWEFFQVKRSVCFCISQFCNTLDGVSGAMMGQAFIQVTRGLYLLISVTVKHLTSAYLSVSLIYRCRLPVTYHTRTCTCDYSLPSHTSET